MTDPFSHGPGLGESAPGSPGTSPGSSARAGRAPFRTSRWSACPSTSPARLPRGTPSLPLLAHPQEVLEDLRPVLRVLDLRVELEAEQRAVRRAHRLAGAVLARRQVHEPGRERGDLVVVALPRLQRVRQALEQR